MSRAYSSRLIVECNVTWGIQACLVVKMRFHPVLSNGLVLHPQSSQQLNTWWDEYVLIRDTQLFRWSKKEWYEQGFNLVTVHRPPPYVHTKAFKLKYPFISSVIPVPRKELYCVYTRNNNVSIDNLYDLHINNGVPAGRTLD